MQNKKQLEKNWYSFLWRHIIKRMIDFYKRLWQAFFIASPAWAAVAYWARDNTRAFIILITISAICFIIGVLGIYLDYKDSRKKDKESGKLV